MMIYIAGVTALFLTILAGVPYLGFLREKLYNQYIREEGPASHVSKSGTPTTGGIIIVIPAVITAIICLAISRNFSTEAGLVILAFIMFMLLGFNDDYLKIAKKHNKGIGARRKLLFQAIIALVPTLYGFIYLHESIFLFAVGLFVIVGSSNAVNLTDGLDGLAAGTSFSAFIACAVVAYLKGMPDLAIIAVAIAGSCLGFLRYNGHPAKMFMGDTGSVALGGVLGSIAVMGGFELWLAVIGLVFVIETMSVIIQVISFKTTGKRVFRMSPIHHHFELAGWSEPRVVYTFWIVGLLCAIAGAGLFYALY